MTGWTIVSGQLCDMRFESLDPDEPGSRCCEIASVRIGQLELCHSCARFVGSIPGLIARLEARK